MISSEEYEQIRERAEKRREEERLHRAEQENLARERQERERKGHIVDLTATQFAWKASYDKRASEREEMSLVLKLQGPPESLEAARTSKILWGIILCAEALIRQYAIPREGAAHKILSNGYRVPQEYREYWNKVMAGLGRTTAYKSVRNNQGKVEVEE